MILNHLMYIPVSRHRNHDHDCDGMYVYIFTTFEISF